MTGDKRGGSADGVHLDEMRGTGEWVDGRKHGHWVYFFENGRKAHEGEYIRGKRDGLWTSWYADGPKSGESYYKDDKQNGWCVAWHRNGVKACEGEFEDRQHGLWSGGRIAVRWEWLPSWIEERPTVFGSFGMMDPKGARAMFGSFLSTAARKW